MTENQSENVAHAKPRAGRRAFRWMFLLLALLVLLHLGWGALEMRKLTRMIAQFRRDGEPILPDDFVQNPISDDDNAAIDLRAAARSVDKTGFGELNLDLQLPLTTKETAAITKALANALDAPPAVDSAMGKKGIDWKVRQRTPVIFILLPDLNPQRELTLFLAADVLLAHQGGDDAKAIHRLGQILFISRSVDQQPSLISHLVALGISAVAAERVTQIAPTLRVAGLDAKAPTTAGSDGAADPAEVRALIAALLAQDADNAGQARAMRAERMMQLDAVTAIAAGKLNMDLAKGAPLTTGPDDGPPVTSVLSGYGLKPLLLADARLMLRYMTAAVAAAPASNWPSARSRLPVIPPEIKAHPAMHVFASIMLPSLERASTQQYRVRTDLTLAATSLAVRLYALEHDSRLPAQLSDLAPSYLPAVPLDPMTAGKPLAYISGDQPGAPHAGDPIIYSVGDNGPDEGGSELPTRKSSPPLDRWGMQDAVVHLTQQPRTPGRDDEPDAEQPDSRPTTKP